MRELADQDVPDTGNKDSDRPVRRRTGQEAVSAVRLPEQLTADIDAWAEAHQLARSEAIRRLIELGLKATPAPGTTNHATDHGSTEIEKLAAQQIAEMLDPSLSLEERERRIRRLIEGPPEFTRLRVDLPKHEK